VRVPIVCGHEHVTVGNNVEVQLNNNSGSPLKAWVNATTTNGEFTGLHAYTDENGEYVRIGLSPAPQQFVIQARSSAVSYTTVLSTSYTAAPNSTSSAICEWSATTTIVPG
jgi:hypothetical protein